MRKLIPLFLVFLLCAPALADRVSEARNLFQEANAHFAVGEFAEAAEKFQAAYKLRPDAALLYNAAQSLRLSGNTTRALVLYKNFLQFYPHEKNSEEVRGQIEKLQIAVAASNQAMSAPPTSTAEHIQPILPAEPAPAEPVAAPPVPEAAPPAATTPAVVVVVQPAPTPLYKKWWLWTIVGGVVVGAIVVGAVVGADSGGGKWATTGDVGPGVHAATMVRW